MAASPDRVGGHGLTSWATNSARLLRPAFGLLAPLLPPGVPLRLVSLLVCHSCRPQVVCPLEFQPCHSLHWLQSCHRRSRSSSQSQSRCLLAGAGGSGGGHERDEVPAAALGLAAAAFALALALAQASARAWAIYPVGSCPVALRFDGRILLHSP